MKSNINLNKDQRDSKVYVIAEIGVNHCGKVSLAKEMIYEAKKAGADAVKFQTFTAEKLANRNTPKAPYQVSTTGKEESHFEMLSSLELTKDAHELVFQYCDEVGIDFISTPYDVESATFLNQLGCKVFKTASADIVDVELHAYLGSLKSSVLISTGMSTLGDIEDCLTFYDGDSSVTLLHCVSNYPCSDVSLNLNVLKTLAAAFSFPIGFSDHSIGVEASIMSVAMGVSVIEKHFTLDRDLPGPDHKASILPSEFKLLVNAIRRAEVMLGSPRKKIQSEELDMALTSRKSITLNRPMKAGNIIEPEDLILKRPGNGLKPREIKNVLGLRVRKDLSEGHQISHQDLDDA